MDHLHPYLFPFTNNFSFVGSFDFLDIFLTHTSQRTPIPVCKRGSSNHRRVGNQKRSHHLHLANLADQGLPALKQHRYNRLDIPTAHEPCANNDQIHTETMTDMLRHSIDPPITANHTN